MERRRAADASFVLNRKQDMDAEVYGDAKVARYIIFVSHAWLSPCHTDPDGLHLDIVLATMKEGFMRDSAVGSFRERLYHRWWCYYYMDSEGDVLFFFDMSSLCVSIHADLRCPAVRVRL